MVDSVLPEEIEERLSSSEKEYFKNHVATLQSYMAELDLHLTVVIISVYISLCYDNPLSLNRIKMFVMP